MASSSRQMAEVMATQATMTLKLKTRAAVGASTKKRVAESDLVSETPAKTTRSGRTVRPTAKARGSA